MKKITTALAFVFAGSIVILSAVFWYVGRDDTPPDVSDLAVERPDISAENNAFNYYVSITNVNYWPADSDVVVDFLDGQSVSMDSIDDIIAKNSATMEFIDRGNECKGCISPEINGFDARLTYIAPWRNAGRVMAAKVRRDRLAGEYGQAVDTCGSLLRFADLVQADAECIINYLVAIAIMDIGIAQVQELARDDKMPEMELKRLEIMLDELGPFDSGLVRAMKNEYKFVSNTIDSLINGEFSLDDIDSISEPVTPSFFRRKRISGYFFQPNKTRHMFADYYRDVISNVSSSYGDMMLSDIEEVLGSNRSRWQMMIKPNAIGNVLCSMMIPATTRLLERKSRTVWRVDSTRVLVGLRKFEKINGSLPDKLENLVPEYISALPSDPYDGEPIRYDITKGVIYSVGEDLEDGGGAICDSNHYGRSCASSSSLHKPDLVLEIRQGSD